MILLVLATSAAPVQELPPPGTAAGASFFDCEDIVTPGLPEAGGEAALREQPAAPGILHSPPVAEEPAPLPLTTYPLPLPAK